MSLLSYLDPTGQGLLSKAVNSVVGTQAKSPTQNLSTPIPVISPSQVKQVPNVSTPMPKPAQPITNQTSTMASASPSSLSGMKISNTPLIAPKAPVAPAQQQSSTYVASGTPPPPTSQPTNYGAGVNDYNQYTNNAPQYSPVNPNPDVLGNTGNPTPQPQAPVPTQPQYDPQNNGLYGQLITDLANRNQQSGADYQAAQQRLNDIAKQQTDIAGQQAQKTYEIGARPGDISQATGEQGLLNQLFASKQAALAPQYSAAATQLGAANTQQGLQNTAFGTAISAAAPQFPSYQNPAYNPVTGQYAGGSQSMTDRAIQAGNLEAAHSTAVTQGQQVQMYKSALQQGQNLQSQVTDLIKTFGLNPNDVNKANQGLQLIARNKSDSHYQQLSNYINDIANTYAQVLTPVGGSQTDTTRGIASSMLDATAKGTSLIDTMKSLDNAAQAKIAGVPTQGQSNQGLNQSSQDILSKYGIK